MCPDCAPHGNRGATGQPAATADIQRCRPLLRRWRQAGVPAGWAFGPPFPRRCAVGGALVKEDGGSPASDGVLPRHRDICDHEFVYFQELSVWSTVGAYFARV